MVAKSSLELIIDKEIKIKPKIGDVARDTSEIVIGFVGAVGAGVSTTVKMLADILKEEYDYDVQVVKVSELIRDNAGKTENSQMSISGATRITDLQRIGTDLRNSFGEDYLAAKAVELIALSRAEDGYEDGTSSQPKALRRATIIDSIKHQEETRVLRRVYGDLYWQFTVFAPENVRETRLRDMGVEKTLLSGIFTRDDNDQNDHGQKVSKTAALSDFFLRNDHENTERLKSVLDRFMSLMFNTAVNTPTSFEAGMYAAVAAANKSACLSRQVGASIYSAVGELISVGWNDVPKSKGGLYLSDDDDKDHRCFKWKGKICHNDDRKDSLYSEIYTELRESGLLSTVASVSDVRAALKRTGAKNLIEFSRSIHAEMEAIVSAARSGKSGILGGKLFTTTFPCHNCARHIVAAGVKEVFYIEPYSKSLALDLHGDSITLVEDGTGKVRFLQYEGVGPSSMLKLFQHGIERKLDGKASTLDKKTALPVLPPPLDGFTTHENRIIARIKQAEDS